ncbi:MAG TPA: rod shape-determining protein RodA [Firmicutes bacterium]|nr:rod shape-determining protein RodA [Bacillota bacterium]
MSITTRNVRELIDWPLAIATLALIAIGIVGISSATGEQAASRVQGLATIQAVWATLAVSVAIATLFLPVRFWHAMAYVIYGVSIAALVATLFAGSLGMGAERWLQIGPMRVQPSEFGKLALILALSRFLSGPRIRINRFWDLSRALALVIVPVVLIRQQPDLGTALVYLAVALPMVFFAGLRNLYLFLILSPIVNAICAFAGWIPWLAFCLVFVGLLFLTKPSTMWTVVLITVNLGIGIVAPIFWDELSPYQQRRIETFFNPENDPLGAGYQIIQSKVAIGSGGMWGKGFQQGTQTQLAFIPETHTDFIFAVLAEEFGFVGAIVVIGLLLFAIWRIIGLANTLNNRFASFICIGVGTLIAFHALVNIGMTVGLMPVTGLPLPFVSYGGSAMLTDGYAIGLVLSLGLRRFE